MSVEAGILSLLDSYWLTLRLLFFFCLDINCPVKISEVLITPGFLLAGLATYAQVHYAKKWLCFCVPSSRRRLHLCPSLLLAISSRRFWSILERIVSLFLFVVGLLSYSAVA
jgi:hypothetical protein